MAPRATRAVRCSVEVAAFSLAVLLTLAGCGEKTVTAPPAPQPPPQPGNIVIDTQPDSLNGPWRLTGPVGYALSGRADTTLTGMAGGEYLITWEAVADWSPPFAQKKDLAPAGEIRFQGIYSLDNPFAGLEFGTDATFEVVTWNLEHFPKNDQVTVDLVARAIMAMDVDLLALQEIESAFYFGDLDDKLAGWTGIRASGSAYDINLAYLYRNSGDWEVDSVREILTQYDREFPRAPYVMEGRFKGTAVVVINNHLKCCGDNFISTDPWDEETRRRDAGILLDDYVRDNFADRKVIVVGDMNDSLTDSPASNVFNVFLEDPAAWRVVDMAIALGPPSGWSYPGWPSHLDHILVTAPLFDALDNPAAAVSVLPVQAGFPGGWNEYDHNLSDHLPVAVKLIP